MADVTQVFLKEVDDALHEERLRVFWENYKVWIVAGVLAVFVSVGGWQVWKGIQTAKAQRVAEQWNALGNMEGPAKQEVLTAVARDGSVGFKALASMEMAREALAQTPPDVQGAAGHYAKVAADKDAPAWLTALARFNRAVVLLEAQPAEAKAELDAILAQTNNPMIPLALELRALVAMNEGDTPNARVLTQRVLDMPDIPADLRNRAAARLGALSTLAK